MEFGKRLRTIGYDKSERKLATLRAGSDLGGEVPAAELRQATRLEFASEPAALRAADFILVAVPTPVDAAHQPEFGEKLAPGGCFIDVKARFDPTKFENAGFRVWRL